MNKTLVTLLVAGTALFAAVSPAAAQSSDAALVKVPFQFIVGNTMMPAGTYRISAETANWSVLMISSADGKAAAVFASTEAAVNPAPQSRDPQVWFDNYYGQYFLREVAMPARNARLVKITRTQAAQTLAKLNLMPAERAEPAK